ncbi:MAG TPA: NlpC-P60 family protein, partial [Lysobacter sp.]
MRLLVSLTTALLLAAVAAQPSAARDSTVQRSIPAHGVIGVEDAQLDPSFWVERLADADRVVLDRDAIAAQNARLQRLDRSLHDLDALPPTVKREQVAGWVSGLSRRPTKPLFDERGQPVPAATIDDTVADANLDAIPAQQP